MAEWIMIGFVIGLLGYWVYVFLLRLRKMAEIEREKVVKELTELNDEAYGNYVHSHGPFFVRVGRACEDALALLKEQEWKLITEDSNGILHGLPGDDGQYLMTDGKDIWIDDYVDGADDGVWLDSGRDIREIKAWMYMPELPE